MTISIQLARLPHGEGLPVPTYATPGAAGMDIQSAEDVTIPPGGRHAVATGFRVAIPEGYEIQVRPRSGLALKHGITVPNTPGTIDSVEAMWAMLQQESPEDFVIERGMRVAQIVPAAVTQASFVEVEELDETERGAGGFGSTGTK